MRPFPPKTELEFLVGQRLSQIRLDPFCLTFIFDQGGAITSEYRLEYLNPSGNISSHIAQDRWGPDPLRFQSLLNLMIARLHVEELALALIFEGGETLRVETELGPYESGHISRPQHPSGDGATGRLFIF